MITRRKSRLVSIGSVEIGANAPIAIQSMAKTHTDNIESTVHQIHELEALKCHIIRVAVPDVKAVKCLGEIKKRIHIPLVADIHFGHNLALEAINQGVDKIRINPGNMQKREKLEDIVRLAKKRRIPIRIGVNSGSIRDQRGNETDLVELMVNTTLRYCEHFESLGFKDIIISLKASDVQKTMQAYRSIAGQCDYPLHLGVTAAGAPEDAVIKSAIGIGGLLSEGIGDTLRVSYTGTPHQEVRAGYKILEAIGLVESSEAEILSCPTCGRCEIDLVKIVEDVKRRLPTKKQSIQIAVMGCVVNGPGEAMDADIGIAGGNGFGLLFRKGEKIRKIPENEMVTTLLEEIESLQP
ncbi:MAG: flavodoxin-dependent (E)-4-hydroxy-3-methylbut-2-enyl-diphosphate synthase [Candidatus Scalindua sp. AMX11]|nr:MAG: flavodoxin-dependent (E)-4-hydroxy-3-methylbut-2-enyl-diphosphate synthase [Candidatus Scalindua sp.]NOG83360.1 flavodoxin-dependent (E)-4-hydroxy-3-methylbut-2-enyl-diphosphate synthase [Planctomycetota bacterium]RZV76739.1 MAG: flavodoxin-dependent (E)-4-hydroxy-3-methylbut-2-enyl-diphosphate synthase [Candidatus Scalindua sp. SCAELEC01]TDE63362.1 MAG: flavodoxin-dependent (E)-4-hydroxy-3-methylbut-2-enyl-diphosphate synthase [Candidatus Scalindua sp. AMX11]GJQ57355.1 MAG: 4-hydroxy-3